MSVLELVTASVWSLTANKLRSALTMIGIFIGVASILAILAIGSGGKAAILSTLESARLQQTIQVVPSELLEPGIPQPGQPIEFTPEEFNLARQFSGVADVYDTLYGQAAIASSSHSANASVEAGPDFLDEIGHFTVISGRMFSGLDVVAHRRVVLLSSALAQQLFGKQNPLGHTVTIQGQALVVIGTATSSQGNLLSGLVGGSYAYLPATTCTDLFPWWTVSEMDVQAEPNVNKEELSRRIVTALNIHANSPGAFEDSSGSLVGIEKTISTVTTILTLVIGSIAGIALIVGGIGVMNIMLVSVRERTQEIGIRIALGATERDIMLQFLIESATLTMMGGLLGVVAGFLASMVIHAVVHFPTYIPWWADLGSVLFSGVVGIVCGLYPANQAAKLNPIDALRHE